MQLLSIKNEHKERFCRVFVTKLQFSRLACQTKTKSYSCKNKFARERINEVSAKEYFAGKFWDFYPKNRCAGQRCRNAESCVLLEFHNKNPLAVDGCHHLALVIEYPFGFPFEA